MQPPKHILSSSSSHLPSLPPFHTLTIYISPSPSPPQTHLSPPPSPLLLLPSHTHLSLSTPFPPTHNVLQFQCCGYTSVSDWADTSFLNDSGGQLPGSCNCTSSDNSSCVLLSLSELNSDGTSGSSQDLTTQNIWGQVRLVTDGRYVIQWSPGVG